MQKFRRILKSIDFVRNPPETVQPTLLYGFAQNIHPATSLNTTLNFAAYPTSNGVVTGLPAIANNATPYHAAGQWVNVAGFGSVNSPAAGAPGGPRTLFPRRDPPPFHISLPIPYHTGTEIHSC